MHDDLVHLEAADAFDRRLTELKAAKRKLDAGRADAKHALTNATQALEQLDAALADSDAQQKAIARETEKYERRLQSAQRVLEGGGGDPEAAERQVVGVTEQLDRLETEMLEQLERVDTLSEQREAAVATHQAATQAHQQAESAYDPAVQALRDEFNGIVPRRDAELAALDSLMRDKYISLRDRKGSAVARILRNACNACRMVVHQQHLADLKRGLVVPCRGCGRWLIPEETG